MGSIKDLSLMKCLSWCGVRELPEEDKGELVWVKAIALVAKRDGTRSYAAMEKDEDGNPRIKSDFGTCSSIAKIETVHPYMYLSTKYMPTFKNPNRKEERIAWLSIYDHEREWEKLTIKELDKEVLNQAIKNQLDATKR